MVDRDLSQRIMAEVHGLDKMCWRNAVMALAELAPDDGWQYVEGWVSGGIILTMHGWVQHRDTGAIVETTPCYLNGDDDETLTYHPGRRYNRSEVVQAVVYDDRSLPLDEHFAMEAIPPDLIDVYRAAEVAQYGEEVAAWIDRSRKPVTQEAK